MKITTIFLFALAALPWAAYGQSASYDSSGDGMLKGSYYVRQVIYVPDASAAIPGTVDEAITTYGNINFDGSGKYTFNGSYADAANGGTATAFTSTGTYTISASGMGFLSEFNTQSGFVTSDHIIGLVNSKGIFIGSSTENSEQINDLVIAAPEGQAPATNATLSGTYQVAYMDPYYLPASATVSGGDALFGMTADGKGNIGTVNVTGYVGTNPSGTESLSNVTYSFSSNGTAQINFGGNIQNELVAGSEILYTSPDGNFIFGGSANGFDIFVGVRAASTNPSTYNALYYQAGLDLDNTSANSGYVSFDSYYGAMNVFTDQFGVPDIIGDQRLDALEIYGGTAEFTYYDNYTLNGDGSSTDAIFSQKYYSSADGSIRVGFGNAAGLLSLNVAFQAPTFTGSGVFLNPTGVVNAASSAPFTAFLSPGEFLTLGGTNLASGPAAGATSLPLPTKLNNVQVMINGVAAPIDFVSPTQINVIVPFQTSSIAQIQVINGASKSNIFTQFVGQSSAGVFTNPPGGIYDAAAEDVTNGYAIVSSNSPAQGGDSIALFLAGLGAVTPPGTDGAAAPSNPPSGVVSNNTPSLALYDVNGNCGSSSSGTSTSGCAITPSFAGLAPGFAGLYQINFTVPTGLAAGEASLEVEAGPSASPDSDNFEAGFCISSCSSSTSSGSVQTLSAGLARRRAFLHRLRSHRRLPARKFKIGQIGVFRGQPQ